MYLNQVLHREWTSEGSVSVKKLLSEERALKLSSKFIGYICSYCFYLVKYIWILNSSVAIFDHKRNIDAILLFLTEHASEWYISSFKMPIHINEWIQWLLRPWNELFQAQHNWTFRVTTDPPRSWSVNNILQFKKSQLLIIFHLICASFWSDLSF